MVVSKTKKKILAALKRAHATHKMEAPRMEGTRPNTTVKGVDISSTSKTLLVTHQGVGDRVKLAWGGRSPRSPWVP